MAGLIALIAFVAVLTGLIAGWHVVMSSRQAVRERINRYVEVSDAADEAAEALGTTLTGWRAFVRSMSRHFEWSGRSKTLEHKLIQAGLPLKGAEFMVICVGTMAAGAAGLFLVSGGKTVMALTGVAIGYMLPVLILRVKAARRVRLFNNQLGDTLIMVANSLRTGYSFLQAVEMVSREMAPPISVEFARLLKEMSLGVTTEEALANMGERLASDDLDLVITAVLIQRQLGGNLAEVLDNIAGTIRARIKLKGEIRTLTAQGRISGLIIGVLPFALAVFIFLVNPGYMNTLFTHPIGKMMLAAALVSQVIGLLLVRKIVNIEY
ncbi:MAG: type II secretion system F family protein [Sporomusaceae bacterium]|nr:type II secretion system F family protein [Sporomusaceae bacterium]